MARKYNRKRHNFGKIVKADIKAAGFIHLTTLSAMVKIRWKVLIKITYGEQRFTPNLSRKLAKFLKQPATKYWTLQQEWDRNDPKKQEQKRIFAYVKKYYKKKSAPKIAAELGIKPFLVQSARKAMNLVLPPDIARNFKNHDRIRTRIYEGKYKPGDIWIATTGGKPYKYIKLPDGSKTTLHRYNYEKKFGEIPKKHILLFRDGDTTNCDVKNLRLISKKANFLENVFSKVSESDGAIAWYLVGRSYPDLFEEVKNNKELIELKRQQLLLKKAINADITTTGHP